MKLSKLEAAQRQLDVASNLFVANADWLAIHTLSGAAEEILGKLAASSRQDNMFHKMKAAAEQQLGRTVGTGELSKLINMSRNALKHANNSNEDPFEYDSYHAVIMLFRALVNYQLVTGTLTVTMEKALSILSKEYPSLLGTKA